ncbi:PEP-CTERM sorting domain-containing protein [Fervidibacter sacchari]
MKAMSKFWMALVVGVAVMVAAIPSWAGPLMPSFPDVWTVGQAVAGQSTLEVTFGSGEPLTVDWIVVFWGNVGPGGKPLWGYYYQIENPETQPSLGKTVSSFTIETPGPPFIAADFFDHVSLDTNFTDIYGSVLGHTKDNYSNLGPTLYDPEEEFEPTPVDDDGDGFINEDPIGDANGDSDPDDDNDGKVDEDPENFQNPTGFGLRPSDVTYYFGPSATWEISVGNQSTVLAAYAIVPPTYGIATAMNSGVSWGGKVPIPSPEPGTVVLLVLGTVGMGILRRYRRK